MNFMYKLSSYFHFKMAENAYISTGVLVKSDVGGTGMPTYAIGDPDFDSRGPAYATPEDYLGQPGLTTQMRTSH